MKNTQIILNPIHTPMGHFPKMEKRREYFSAGNKYYFSVSQNGTMKRNGIIKTIPMDSRRLQYAFFNGKSFGRKPNLMLLKIFKYVNTA